MTPRAQLVLLTGDALPDEVAEHARRAFGGLPLFSRQVDLSNVVAVRKETAQVVTYNDKEKIRTNRGCAWVRVAATRDRTETWRWRKCHTEHYFAWYFDPNATKPRCLRNGGDL